MTPIINISTWNASIFYLSKNATIGTILLLSIVLGIGIVQEVML